MDDPKLESTQVATLEVNYSAINDSLDKVFPLLSLCLQGHLEESANLAVASKIKYQQEFIGQVVKSRSGHQEEFIVLGAKFVKEREEELIAFKVRFLRTAYSAQSQCSVYQQNEEKVTKTPFTNFPRFWGLHLVVVNEI